MELASDISAICAAGALVLTVGGSLIRVGQLSNKVTANEQTVTRMQSDIDSAHRAVVALAKSVSSEYVHNSVVDKLEANIARLSDRVDNGFNMLATRIDNLLGHKPNA